MDEKDGLASGGVDMPLLYAWAKETFFLPLFWAA